jgi:single-strand DNA-binding protein
MGNLTKEPELNYTTNGTPVANFRLAVNSKSGGREKVLFIDCALFGKIAEICNKYADKGSNVFVAGELENDSWTDSNGQARSKIMCIVRDFRILGGWQEDKPQDDIE